MRISLIIVLLVSFCRFSAQDLYFPPTFGNEWETIDPSELNWCSDSLEALQTFLDEKNSKAFIILKDGKIVTEWYFDEFTEDSLWYWASAGKSLTSFLIGLAQEDGLLDISTPSSNFLGGPGWTSATASQESQITIWNQLTMTSGLDDGVTNSSCWDAPCLHYLADAGTRWAYHNAPYTLLDSVITTATEMDINAYLFNKLGFSTGIIGAFVPVQYNNIFFSKPRVMARFGLLALAEGNWNGTTIMSDNIYFNQMVNTSQEFNKSYGLLWWLNGKGEHMLPGLQFTFNQDLVPNAPDDMYAAMGRDDQRIYVVPSQNLVAIRAGEAANESLFALSQFDNELWAKISGLACEPLSISSLQDFEINISPNPSNDYVIIETELNIDKIEIFDSTGRSQGVYSNKHLDLTYLENGTYIFLITLNDGAVLKRKIVKL